MINNQHTDGYTVTHAVISAACNIHIIFALRLKLQEGSRMFVLVSKAVHTANFSLRFPPFAGARV